MVVTAPSIAHAASTALPPLANISAPAVAASGLPVMASQCLAWSGGFWVCCDMRVAAVIMSAHAATPARTGTFMVISLPRAGGGRRRRPAR